MFKPNRVALIVSLSITCAAGFSLAQSKEKKAANPAFEKMKSLVGDWTNADAKGADKDKVTVSYSLVSGGSVVLETMKGMGEDGMITVYHMDGDHLVMTHYCALGNQPHMQAGDLKDGKLSFTCKGGTNMKSEKDMHMHALTITFTDNDHMTADWTFLKDGKDAESHPFHHVRKK